MPEDIDFFEEFILKNGSVTLNWDDCIYLSKRICRCNCITALYDDPSKNKNLVLLYALSIPESHECTNPRSHDI